MILDRTGGFAITEGTTCNFNKCQHDNSGVTGRRVKKNNGDINSERQSKSLAEDFTVPSSRRTAIIHHCDITRSLSYHDGHTVADRRAEILSLALENSCAAFPGRLLPRSLVLLYY